jgi:hypothetical protein
MMTIEEVEAQFEANYRAFALDCKLRFEYWLIYGKYMPKEEVKGHLTFSCLSDPNNILKGKEGENA